MGNSYELIAEERAVPLLGCSQAEHLLHSLQERPLWRCSASAEAPRTSPTWSGAPVRMDETTYNVINRVYNYTATNGRCEGGHCTTSSRKALPDSCCNREEVSTLMLASSCGTSSSFADVDVLGAVHTEPPVVQSRTLHLQHLFIPNVCS
jgi:hypothetical protein